MTYIFDKYLFTVADDGCLKRNDTDFSATPDQYRLTTGRMMTLSWTVRNGLTFIRRVNSPHVAMRILRDLAPDDRVKK